MGLLGLLKFVVKAVFIVLFTGFIIAIIPGLPPRGMQFTADDVVKTKEFTGSLALNRRFDNAERLFEGKIHGPEGLVYHEGALYTGLHGGHVVKIVSNNIIPVVKFGKPCAGLHEEHICGRPLGMVIKKGSLYITDAYYGLFKVNLTTKEVQQLVSPDTVIEGRKPMLFNSVVVASDSTVYWTDSDSNIGLHNGAFSILADGTGRLIKYDPITKKNTVLIDRIKFSNGVALSADESYIIVAETLKYRILRFYLKGSKKGTSDVFVDGLPGIPDNLKSDGKGNFYVPLLLPHDQSTPSVLHNINRYPLLRKSLARIMTLMEILLEYAKPICPEQFCEKAIHAIGHFETTTKLIPKNPRFTLLKVSRDGYIINSFHALDGSVTHISDIEPVGDYLYLGSPFNKYLARVPLPKEFKF